MENKKRGYLYECINAIKRLSGSGEIYFRQRTRIRGLHYFHGCVAVVIAQPTICIG